MNSKAIYSIYYTFLIFIYVYGFNINPIDVNSTKIAAVFILIEFLFLQKLYLYRGFIKMIIYLFFIIAYAHIVTIYFDYYDNFFPRKTYALLIEDLGVSIVFGSNVIARGYRIRQILILVINAISIQAVIILLMFIVVPFRELIFNIFTIRSSTFLSTEFRGLGLSLNLFYDFGFLQSFGLVLLSYFYYKEKRISWFQFFKYLIILISVFFTARTGLIGIIISLVIFIYTFLFLNRYVIKSILQLTIKILIIVVVFSFFLPKKYSDIFHKKLYPWFFEWLESYKSQGTLQTASTEILTNRMYYELPTDTFWFGTGVYQYDRYKFAGDTDAGYMRIIIYFGLLGSIILYSYYIYMIFQLYSSGDKEYIFIPILFIICLFIVHYKGDVFTGSPLNLRLLHFMFVVTILSRKYCLKKSLNY